LNGEKQDPEKSKVSARENDKREDDDDRIKKKWLLVLAIFHYINPFCM